MKSHILAVIVAIFIAIVPTQKAHAAQTAGFDGYTALSLGIQLTGFNGINGNCGEIAPDAVPNLAKYKIGTCDENGQIAGLIPRGAGYIASLYQLQPSGREYVADIIDSIGLPQVSRTYAQATSGGGTGYKAMSAFLPYWKAFRNLAYSLYIIMFVVIGIMIMLRTKINAQTIITIQAALPNLLMTLILITFSYAIVGFMIDIMYFLIYFIVFLFSSIGVLDGTKAATRLMSHSAWGIIFAGRNTIISAVAQAFRDIIGAGSTGGVIVRVVAGIASAGISELALHALPYLIAAIWLAITMLKLIFVLTKAYIMLIIQTVTAPVQILMNAMPGSKAFGEWLKKTASYLIPFPVAAAMFITAAVVIGDPTNAALANFKIYGTDTQVNLDNRDANPFGVTQTLGGGDIWTPPFTIDLGWRSEDIMVLMGFFIFAMTPAAVKMAQDWLQVKESPYAAEAFSGLGAAWTFGQYPTNIIKGIRHEREAQTRHEQLIDAMKQKP